MVRQGQKEVTSMKARRYELTDKEWELIRPLIPISHTGRPQKDIRAHLNGILWLAAVVRAGAIFRRDSVRIRLCTAASAAGGMMEL